MERVELLLRKESLVSRVYVVGICTCCGSKVCKQCAGCHCVDCDEHESFCAALRADKHASHRRRQLSGVQRRLRGKLKMA